MRTLTFDELGFVAGGFLEPFNVVGETGKKWWEEIPDRIRDAWDDFWRDDPPAPNSSPIQITADQLGQMQRDCIAAGKNFTYQSSSESAGADLKVVNANGSTTYVTISCTS